MSQTATFKRRQYEWYHIVELSGEAGRRWMAEYRRLTSITRDIADALPLMRRGALEAGREKLAGAWEALSAAEIEDPSIRAVAERWYFGALGYCLYRREEFDAADRVMIHASDVVAGALGRWDFLLIMADEAVDMCMHRARIARNRRRWADMRALFERAWAMREGRLPYHVLADGTTISVHDVRAMLSRLPVPEGTLVAPHLQSAEHGRRDFERFVLDITRIPGFVIHQP